MAAPYTEVQYNRGLAFLNSEQGQFLPQAPFWVQAMIKAHLTPQVLAAFNQGYLTAVLTEPTT